MSIQREEEYAQFPKHVRQPVHTHALHTVYLDPVLKGKLGWPVAVIVDGIPDIENVTHALRDGSYGRCVYEHDNNVCDNQVCTAYTRPSAFLTPPPCRS